MKLIVGLGNPGAKYAGNRHNIGFMAVDEILRRHSGFQPWRARFQGQVSEGRLGSEKVLLLKPSTYMNESGRSVGEAMRFYKIEPEDIVVLYDELDLPPAKFRMKKGGGHGGRPCARIEWTCRLGGDCGVKLRRLVDRPTDEETVGRRWRSPSAQVSLIENQSPKRTRPRRAPRLMR